jgi:copper chaperone
MKFLVENISCGHCVRAVTTALQAADASAQVAVDLQEKQVTVASKLAAEHVLEILNQEGYPAQRLD